MSDELNRMRRHAGLPPKIITEETKTVSLSKDTNELKDKPRQFILVHDPISDETTPADMIAVMDGSSFALSFIGASSGINDAKVVHNENWTLYHYNQMNRAIEDANKRLENAGLDFIVTESTVIEAYKNKYSVGDKVNTPFGEGKIVEELESTRQDKFFTVQTDDGKKTRMGSFELKGHVSEDCGMSHEDEEEMVPDREIDNELGADMPPTDDTVKEVDCPLCDWKGNKDEFYDHMMSEHPEVFGDAEKEDDAEEETMTGDHGEGDMEMSIELEGARSPSDEEFDQAVAALKKENPTSKIGGIGVDKDTGDINIETMAGDEFILRKATGKLELMNEGAEVKFKDVKKGFKFAKKNNPELVLTKTAANKYKKSGVSSVKKVPNFDIDPEETVVLITEAKKEKKVTKKKATKKKTAKKKTSKKSTPKAETNTNSMEDQPKEWQGKSEDEKMEKERDYSCPADVKSEFKKKIAELRKRSKDVERTNPANSEFHERTAEFFEDVMKELEKGKRENFVKASTMLDSIMLPMERELPEKVRQFMRLKDETKSNMKMSLKDLFMIKRDGK